MPRDPRLFMTFPIEFPEHPKVKPLSVPAKWAFVEMNAYSRRYDMDGVIPATAARANWAPKVLAELVASHPDRPLVLIVEGAYVIRDYAEHQETTESIQKRRETNAANGRKGGRPASAKQVETQPVTESVSESEPNEKQSPESRVQSPEKTDVTTLRPVPSEIPARAGWTDEEVAAACQSARIRDLEHVTTTVQRVVGPVAHVAMLFDLVIAVGRLSLKPIKSADAYLDAVCIQSPDEITKAWRVVSDDWDNAVAARKAVAS